MLAYIPYMDPMGLNPPLLTSFSSRAIADDAPPLRWWRHCDRHVQSFYFSVGLSVWATDAQIRLLDLTNLTEFVFLKSVRVHCACLFFPYVCHNSATTWMLQPIWGMVISRNIPIPSTWTNWEIYFSRILLSDRLNFQVRGEASI